MASEPVPFANLQQSGHEKLAGASPLAMNVVVDGKGTVMRRPALLAATGVTSSVVDSGGVSGVRTSALGVTYAVGDAFPRNIFEVGPTSPASLSAVFSEELQGSLRPTFAETEMLMVVAAGSYPQKLEILNASASSRLDDTTGTGVPQCSHILANANRLVSNDVVIDRTKIRFSGQAQGTTTFAGHELWSGSGLTALGGFFTAEARPDNVVAVYENTSEVFVFGVTNVEVYSKDALFVYSRVAAREYGCVAPYSVVNVDQQFCWLDHRRRFVMSDGRSFDDTVGQAIQQDIDDMETVDDCFGFRIHQGPVDALVWVFPTDGRTFAFQKGVGWGQWAGWNQGTNNWKPFPVNCHYHRNDNDEDLVGTTDGKVLQLKLGQNDDVGERVHAYVETGYLDRGSNRLKQCVSLRLVLERGVDTGSTTQAAFVQWSDRPGVWSSQRPLNMGIGGDTQPVVELRSLGTYRRRAWRFTFSPDVDLKLIEATEEFETLEV